MDLPKPLPRKLPFGDGKKPGDLDYKTADDES